MRCFKIVSVLLSLVCLLSPFASSLAAEKSTQNLRWFEIELFIFSRDSAENNKDNQTTNTTLSTRSNTSSSSAETTQETFEKHIKPILINNARDLITPVLFPDIAQLRQIWLPQCEPKPITKPLIPLNNIGLSELSPNELQSQLNSYLSRALNTSNNTQVNNLSSSLNNNLPAELETLPALPTALDEARVFNQAKVIDGFKLDKSVAQLLETPKPSWHYPALCHQPEPNLFHLDWIKDKARKQQIALSYKLDKTPVRITQTPNIMASIAANQPYLLDSEQLEFRKSVTKFRWRKELTPLIHLSWRQPVLPQKQETPWRIYAGKNYSEKFEYQGQKILQDNLTEQNSISVIQADQPTINPLVTADKALNHQDVLDNIQNVLNKIEDKTWDLTQAQSQNDQQIWLSDQQLKGTPNKVWQLDGLFKIYLRHYLFIETEFNIREVGQIDTHTMTTRMQGEMLAETATLNNKKDSSSVNSQLHNNLDETSQDFLHAYHFKQNKRIRSGEIHYFDHPKMGIVLQVRRVNNTDVIKQAELAEQEVKTIP